MTPCPKCDGKGKISYRTPRGDTVTMDDGTTITDMGGWSCRACECVRDLPAIEGKATWWDMEVIYGKVVSIPIGNECGEITAECEIPRDDEGRRVVRDQENAYYPALVSIEGYGRATLFAEDARALAAALIEAAEVCEKADSHLGTAV